MKLLCWLSLEVINCDSNWPTYRTRASCCITEDPAKTHKHKNWSQMSSNVNMVFIVSLQHFLLKFTIFIHTIVHLVYSPKVRTTIVFDSRLGSTIKPRRKWEPMVLVLFFLGGGGGGLTRSITVYVIMVNWSTDNKLKTVRSTLSSPDTATKKGTGNTLKPLLTPF